jgi:hypothetical protein
MMLTQQVFVGGDSGIDDLINKPDAWQFVRENADGFYTNFAWMLLDAAGNIVPEQQLIKIAALFSNKATFYETDLLIDCSPQLYKDIFEDRAWKDQRRIDYLRSVFNNNVPYATICNVYSASADILVARMQGALQWRQRRTVLAMQGPYDIGGDINNPNDGSETGFKAWAERCAIGHCDGSATDGPMGCWAPDNDGNMVEGSFSMVRYSHDLGKLAMVMIAPSNKHAPNGPGDNLDFFTRAQTCVWGHEDHHAMPDIWAISYYGGKFQQYQMIPEIGERGFPGWSITGVAYWLICFASAESGRTLRSG